MPAPALRIPVELDTEALQQQMSKGADHIREGLKKIDDHFHETNTHLEEDARKTGNNIGMLIAAGLTAALAGVATGLIATIGHLAKFGDLADELRLPVNLLQALNLAAVEARVPAENLTRAMEKFAEASKKGGTDAEKLDEALTRIGPNFQKAFASAPTQAERLRVLADALKAADTEAKRAQLGLQALGTDNERLLSIFEQGRGGLEAHIERMRDLGLAVDANMIEQAKKAKSELGLLAEVTGNRLVPALASLYRAVLPLIGPLEKLATVLGATIGVLHERDETRPTSTFEMEIEALNRRAEQLRNLRDDLANQKVGPGDTIRDKLRQLLGLETPVADEIAQIDKDLEAIKARMKEIDRILAGRQGRQLTGQEPGAFERREPLGGAAAASRDRFEAAADSIEKRTQALEAETKAIDLGTEARQRARIAAELETVAKQVNKDATGEVNKVTEEQREVIDRLAASYGKAAEAAERARSPLRTFAREAADTMKQFDRFAASGLEKVTDALADIATGAATAQEAFKKLAQSILNDLVKLSIRQAITGPLAGALSGGLNSIIPRQHGGPVSAGQTYMVGESGPELFVPRNSGMIVPNAIAQSAAGGGMMFAPVTNIDARGSQMTEGQFRTILAANNRQMLSAVAQAAPARQRRLAMLGT